MNLKQRLKQAIQVFRESSPDMQIQSTARGDYISAQYNIQPYNPDALLSKKGYDIIEEMRNDDQVRAVMTLKKFARISTGWVIQPASSSKSDTAAAEFCKWNLENLAGTFNKHLYQLMSALDYGFSITEKNWELSKEGVYNGKIILQSLKTRKPDYFTFYQDEHGNLEKNGVAQEQVDNSIKPMSADKFLLYTYQEEFDNLYGRSDYRAFYREWWIKSVILKFYAMWLERFPFPPTIGWYPHGTTDTDIDALEDILEHLQTGTIATFPMGINLDQLEVPATASDAYKVALDVCNKGITRGALVPDLLGFSESGSRGSYALGKKHFDVFLWILEDLGSSISALINEQLLTQITGYNFDADPPTFQMISPDEDPETKSKILKILLDAMVVDPDEEWVRDYMNVPQRNQPYIRKFHHEIHESHERTRNESLQESPDPSNTIPEPFPYRPLTEYEKAAQVDFQETKFFLEKWVSDVSKTVSDLLAKQISQMMPEIKAYFVDKDYRSIRNLKLDTKEMETAMEGQFMEVYLFSMANGVGELEKSLNQRLAFSETLQSETFQDAPTPAERLKQFIGRVPLTKAEWIKLVSGFKSKAFTIAGFIEKDIIREIQWLTYRAIDEDWFVRDLVKEIERSQVQYTGKAWTLPPETPMKDYHTKLIFRNAISDIYNGARRDLYFDPEVDEFVPALQYSAILDERTRQTHRDMDEKIYPKSDPIWKEWWPPNGHNCRCTVIPVTANMDFVVSEATALRADTGFGKP